MGKWNSVANEIFLQALEQDSPTERLAYLDQACGADTELRAEIESLLAAQGQVGDFLETPALGKAGTGEQVLVEQPGTQIDRYKLLELIGEGGFGNVYMAEQQEPVRRKVALKIIKLGMDTRQVIARFEAERQAVALMDHPSIAKVLDAGATETGRPYFVMELVRGVPITEYCDAHDLPTRARLQLFVDVCRAVQHAHQKGIIHRDLKPNNVLVTQQDGQPVPKIIDFGVAKATQQRLTEKTLFTEHRQLVGTPEYMSPEQATFCETDVDTRSDIYSLGVLLYELLVGATPFDAATLRQHGYDEICRVIRETEPPTPSKRLSSISAAAITDISKHRHAEPAALRRLLRGDLDWIVMKCLEKERTRRYETAHGLARDVERHLSDEPVQARPPSAGYQLQKFVRKHRGTVTAVSAVGVALILGLLISTIGFVRAERERQVAIAERDRAQENLQLARQLVSEVIEPGLWQMADLPFSGAYLGPMLEQTRDFYEKILEQAPDDPEAQRYMARIHFLLGRVAYGHGQDAAAEYRRSIAILENLVKQYPDNPDYRFDVASSRLWFSFWLQGDLRLADALAERQKSQAIVAELSEEFPLNEEYQDSLALGNTGLARRLVGVGRFQEAEPLFLSTLKSPGKLSRFTRFETRETYAYLLVRMGRFREAEELLLEAFQIAQEEYVPATTPESSGWVDSVYRVSANHLSLGRLYYYLGKFAEAESHLREAIPPVDALSPGFSSAFWLQYHVGCCQHDLAEVLTITKRLEEAEAARRAALAACEAAGDPGAACFPHGWSLAHYRLGELLYQTGRTIEAAREFGSAQALMEKLAERQPECPVSNWPLICLLANCPDEALRDPQQAVEIARRVTPPNDGPSWRHLALALYRNGEWSAAREAIERSMDLRQGGDAIDGLLLAMALWQLGKEEEALKQHAEAQAKIAAGQPIFYEYLGVMAIQSLQREVEDLLGENAKNYVKEENL